MNLSSKTIQTFIRFGLSGLPGFVLALAVNIWVIERYHWPKPVAYLLVMWIQMTAGFLMCRNLVFQDGRNVSILRAYGQFALSMGLIRVFDWSLYTALVEGLHVKYVIAQIVTSGIFLFVKFISARAIFRPRSTTSL